jgi:hypothetical protein
MRPSLRSSICSSVCLLAMLGCAAPKPVTTTTANVGPTRDIPETDAQRAQRLINHSAETGEPINTAEGKKLICKQESVTNTRLKTKKTCLTEDEWIARTNNAKDGLHEATRAGEYLPPKGN